MNYFKLDANYWGALQGGKHYQDNATRIEAYRRGMEAVLRGCDDETVVLGCNGSNLAIIRIGDSDENQW